MERMTPEQSTLEAYKAPPPNERVVQRLQKEAEDSDRVTKEALCFMTPV